MNMLFRAAMFAVLVGWTPGTAVAQDEAAGIFAGAKALYSAAQTKSDDDRIDDYRGVRRLLDLIVEEYPSSDLAVSILLQDNIDGLDVAAVDAALDEAEPTGAVQTAVDTPQGASTQSSPLPTEDNQRAAIPPEETNEATAKPEAPPRTEKEIVLDIQNELNRVGCPAGPADGVVGRKTRTAFSNFLTDSGANLSDEQLVSEEAVAVLKSQEGTVCKVRTMASTPASALSGSWGFRSDCPGFGNRVIRNTGSMNLRYRGNNTLQGSARNRQGNTGSATIQFQGSRTAATIIKFGFVTLRGNLTRSRSNMTISGTGNNRCNIVAWKN